MALPSYAQNTVSTQPSSPYVSALPYMPAPNKLLNPSPLKNTPLLRGIKIYPADPFKFDFIIDQGDNDLTSQQLKTETDKLIRYFLAGLTIPEGDLWVNLSPYEQNRITPEELGQTDLGKDMLGLDYVLKQLAASLTYPEQEPGKSYWQAVNNETRGIASLQKPSSNNRRDATLCVSGNNKPTQSFNKIWIIPESATIYQDKDKAFITDSKLKVMMEKDYVAGRFDTSRSLSVPPKAGSIETNGILSDRSTTAFKTHILPLIEKEVNQGEHFAQLRQIYHSLLLAAWFKNNLKQSIINRVYSNQNKISGVNVNDPKIKEKIYQQYCEAFKQGAYNYVKRECLRANNHSPLQKIIRRQYFSGGMDLENLTQVESSGERPLRPGSSVLRRVTRAVSATVILATLGAATLPGCSTGVSDMPDALGMPDVPADSAQPKAAERTTPRRYILTEYDNLLASARAGNKDTLKKLIEQAEAGDDNAVWGLRALASEDNPETKTEAKRALTTLNTAGLAKEIESGGHRSAYALEALDTLIGAGHKSAKRIRATLKTTGLARQAKSGGSESYHAIHSLHTLHVDGNNQEAGKTLHTLGTEELAKQLESGSFESYSIIDSLKLLDQYKNPGARKIFTTAKIGALVKKIESKSPEENVARRVLVSLADNGHEEAFEFICKNSVGNNDFRQAVYGIANSKVLELRQAHLERGISGQALVNLWKKINFGDSLGFKYAAFISPENFTVLSAIIFDELSAEAKKQGTDIFGLIERLDPQKAFTKDFLLQAANFNLLGRLANSPESLDKLMKWLFEEMNPKELSDYAVKYGLFLEDVFKDKTFQYRKEFEGKLQALYTTASGPKKYFLGALISVYADDFKSLPREFLEELQNRYPPPEPVPIPIKEWLADGHLDVDIIFADEDAQTGHFAPTIAYFMKQFKSYKPQLTESENSATIIFKGVVIRLFKSLDGQYDIAEHIGQAKIVISRSHAGRETDVFKQGVKFGGSRLGIMSACLSATKVGKVSNDYPGMKVIGVRGTAKGRETNDLTVSLIKTILQIGPNGKITYAEAARILRDKVESGTNFVLPDDPAQKVLQIFNQTAADNAAMAQARADWESSLKEYLTKYFTGFTNQPAITPELIEELWQIHLLGAGYHVVDKDPNSPREYNLWNASDPKSKNGKRVKGKDLKPGDTVQVRGSDDKMRPATVVETTDHRLVFTGNSSAVNKEKRERSEQAWAKVKAPDPYAVTDALLKDTLLGSEIKDSEDGSTEPVGGLDMNTSNAQIKLTGKTSGLNISNQDLPFDPKKFKGFTYSIVRLEKIQNQDAGF